MKINFLPLRRIIKWSLKTKTPKPVFNQSTNDSERVDDASMLTTKKKDADRRLQDVLSKDHPKRKMNLDRRAVRSERRVDGNPHYTGPVRRYTVDRRLNLKDRRDNG